jgi:hypothetical protein
MDGFSADMLTPSAVITSTCCQKSCHQDNPPDTLRTRLKIARIIRRNQQRRDITLLTQKLNGRISFERSLAAIIRMNACDQEKSDKQRLKEQEIYASQKRRSKKRNMAPGINVNRDIS